MNGFAAFRRRGLPVGSPSAIAGDPHVRFGAASGGSGLKAADDARRDARAPTVPQHRCPVRQRHLPPVQLRHDWCCLRRRPRAPVTRCRHHGDTQRHVDLYIIATSISMAAHQRRRTISFDVRTPATRPGRFHQRFRTRGEGRRPRFWGQRRRVPSSTTTQSGSQSSMRARSRSDVGPGAGWRVAGARSNRDDFRVMPQTSPRPARCVAARGISDLDAAEAPSPDGTLQPRDVSDGPGPHRQRPRERVGESGVGRHWLPPG